ncbi:MAG: hypothetical protein JWR05_443 [Mucilaginibacter sp.]|nr:hypothetical protein [Mucilaginibacter sp.]
MLQKITPSLFQISNNLKSLSKNTLLLLLQDVFLLHKKSLALPGGLKKIRNSFLMEVFKTLHKTVVLNRSDGQQQINYSHRITLLTIAAKVVQAGIKHQGYTSEPYCSLSAAGSPLTFYPA